MTSECWEKAMIRKACRFEACERGHDEFSLQCRSAILVSFTAVWSYWYILGIFLQDTYEYL